jgi:hypothetical protein
VGRVEASCLTFPYPPQMNSHEGINMTHQTVRTDIVFDALDISYQDGVTLLTGFVKALVDRGFSPLSLNAQAVVNAVISEGEKCKADLLDIITRLYHTSEQEEKAVMDFLDRWVGDYEV